MDVARAVGKDVLRLHPHDQLCAGKGFQERVRGIDAGRTVDAQPFRRLEVDEEQSDARIHEDVAQALEHAVAVVAREREHVGRDDTDESGAPALVRAVRRAVAVGRGSR